MCGGDTRLHQTQASTLPPPPGHDAALPHLPPPPIFILTRAQLMRAKRRPEGLGKRFFVNGCIELRRKAAAPY